MAVSTGSQELVAAIKAATGAEKDLAALAANLVVAIRTKAQAPGSEEATQAVSAARNTLLAKAQFPSKSAKRAFFDQLEPFTHK